MWRTVSWRRIAFISDKVVNCSYSESFYLYNLRFPHLKKREAIYYVYNLIYFFSYYQLMLSEQVKFSTLFYFSTQKCSKRTFQCFIYLANQKYFRLIKQYKAQLQMFPFLLTFSYYNLCQIYSSNSAKYSRIKLNYDFWWHKKQKVDICLHAIFTTVQHALFKIKLL